MINIKSLIYVVAFLFFEETNGKASWNPMEDPSLFEGDILEPPPALLAPRGAQRSRNWYRWKNGVVPYVVKEGDYGSANQNFIIAAMRDLEEKTAMYTGRGAEKKACIKFEPWDASKNGRNYLSIQNGHGCNSYIGNVHRGPQTVNLQSAFGKFGPTSGFSTCMGTGTIQHELMHALGFYHEQSRYDRDEFVEIHWANIKKGMEYNFKKYSSSQLDFQGQPYDFGSLMHYGSTAFSDSVFGTAKTISPKKTGVTLGQRDGPSAIDIKEIQLYYECDDGSNDRCQNGGKC